MKTMTRPGTLSGWWYEVHNPNTGARGLVPQEAFELLGKYASKYVVRLRCHRVTDQQLPSHVIDTALRLQLPL